MTITTAIDVRPLTTAIGAEVVGLDLSHPLGPETVAAVRSALVRHGVLFFRDQRLTPDTQAAFAR